MPSPVKSQPKPAQKAEVVSKVASKKVEPVAAAPVVAAPVAQAGGKKVAAKAPKAAEVVAPKVEVAAVAAPVQKGKKVAAVKAEPVVAKKVAEPKVAKAAKAAKAPKAPKAAKAPKAKKEVVEDVEGEESDDVKGVRSFKVQLPGNEEYSGRFTGLTPYQAANKALSKYFRENKTAKAEITFSIRESTRGSKRSTYTYNGKREKLTIPVKYSIKSADGEAREIVKEYKNRLTKVKKADVKEVVA